MEASRVRLALVDYQLPDTDGLSLIARLRAAGCACVLVTGSSELVEDEDGELGFCNWTKEAVAAGAMSCLPKPIDPDGLLAIVGTVMRPQ